MELELELYSHEDESKFYSEWELVVCMYGVRATYTKSINTNKTKFIIKKILNIYIMR